MVLSGWKNSFFFRDNQYGISVDRDDNLPELHTGDRVRVIGKTGEGRFAPVVVANKVVITGHRAVLPSTRLYTVDDLEDGKQDSQLVTIRGTVQSAAIRHQIGREFLILVIDMGGGKLITARVLDYTARTAQMLNGAVVRVRGICGSVFNTRRQFVGPRLFVANPTNISIERAAPQDLFAGGLSSFEQLGQFRVNGTASSRVKLQGVVTYIRHGRGFYLQRGSQGLYVQSNQTEQLTIGSTIQVVGYPKASTYSPQLINAIAKPTSVLEQVQAVKVSPASLITTGDGFTYAPYDGLLVRVEGKVLNIVPGTDEDLLLLQAGSGVLPVRVPVTRFSKGLPKPGSILQVTAVCSAITDDSHEARSVELLARSRSDLTIVKAGPWWTASNAIWIVGILMSVITVLVVCVTVTRRQSNLRALITTDPLTGLLNRRGFLMYAERQWETARCHNKRMLLCFVDLDRFKNINDTFGHQLGDEALQDVGNLLRECFRKHDVIGRLGGDEFAVTAADSPSFDEVSIRKRLERVLSQKNAESSKGFQISLSMGVLTCDDSLIQSSIEELLSRADKLMYEEKSHHHLAATQQDLVRL